MFRFVAAIVVCFGVSGCCVPFGLGDTAVSDSAIVCFDRDGDGVETCFGARGDCNDFAAEVTDVWSGVEVCNGVDDDCDTLVDEGVGFYPDADGDGFGDDDAVRCAASPGDVTVGGDCDDDDPDAWAGAAERCDGVDNDCNGAIDDGAALYPDADGDGYGDDDLPSCAEGVTHTGGDCDDADLAVNPGAAEVCNAVDDDCDGGVDEASALWTDGDGDGYGADPSVVVEVCASGYTALDGDCDDADPAAWPGAPETCDDVEDLNCDGSVGSTDADHDGFRACDDCDDAAWFVFPGATEICDDGIDEDCDGEIDEDC